MMLSCKWIFLAVSLFTAILILCTKQNPNSPYVSIVVGEAILDRNGKQVQLAAEQYLKKLDMINVSEQSKVKITIGDSQAIYINKNTKLETGNISKIIDSTGLKFILDFGELFIWRSDSLAETTVEVVTPACIISTTDAVVDIIYDAKANAASVFTLTGNVSVLSAGKVTSVPACSKFVFGNDQINGPLMISEMEISELKNWVGKNAVEGPLNIIGCAPKVTSEIKNRPPEWKKQPGDLCLAGRRYVDTVQAIDPENRPVNYMLLKGPKGMIVDYETGVISWQSNQAGTVSVSIRAVDEDSQHVDLNYVLTVTGVLSVSLNAPKFAKPGVATEISASPVGCDPKKVLYRFDLDGDGKYEFGGNNFINSRSVSAVFPREGEFTVKVEIKDPEGRSAISNRKVIVDAPPTASLKIIPQTGPAGSEFTLDAGGITDSGEKSEDILIRWDFDGNGSWDHPSGNEFSNQKKVTHVWQVPGTYTVIIEARDRYGFSDTASARVTVTKGLSVESLKCPDSAHVNEQIAFECVVSAPEYPVADYAWSFDGDTVFEKHSKDKHITYQFAKAGTFNVFCKITDQIGQSARQQKTVKIVNTKTLVDAKGPYKARVNKPCTLEGEVKDVDSKIKLYSWDFNGDGKTDWSSATTSRTEHVFTRAGTFTVFMTAVTSDGDKTTDSALVTVGDKPPVVKACEDIVSYPDHKIKLSGIATDPDSNIVLYRWDFDRDGKIDWSSNNNGIVEHVFKTYSFAVFSAVDAESLSAFDTVRIVICPEEMSTIKKGKFCIDTYEWPGKKGEMPRLGVTYEEAVKSCSEVGKHLCTEREWESACRAENDLWNYPYGNKYQIDRCNTVGNAVIKNKPASSGYFQTCAGSAGVFDMSGNAAEWTLSTGKANPFVYGGSWQTGEDESKCSSKVGLQKGTKYFYAGFRCCK